MKQLVVNPMKTKDQQYANQSMNHCSLNMLFIQFNYISNHLIELKMQLNSICNNLIELKM